MRSSQSLQRLPSNGGWRRNEELEQRNAALTAGLREVQKGRRALEERQLKIERLVDIAASDMNKEKQHLSRQAHSAAKIAATNEELQAQVLALRAAAARSEELEANQQVQLQQAAADLAAQRDRVAQVERAAQSERRRSEAAAAKEAKKAKNLRFTLARSRWRQLAADRELQQSRKALLPEAVHAALKQLTVPPTATAAPPPKGAKAGAFQIHEDAPAAPGAKPKSSWTLDAWLEQLPLAEVMSKAIRARLSTGGDPRAVLASLSSASDEPAAVFSALFTEASLVQRLAEAAEEEVDALAAAQRRRGLSPDPLFGRFVSSSDADFRALNDAASKASLPATGSGDALVAMRAEHCARSDAQTLFMSESYQITTTPEIEFTFVVDPSAIGLASLGLDAWPAEARGGETDESERRRRPTPLTAFEPQRVAIAEKLKRVAPGTREFSREALIACRLYTGPLSLKYNAALKGVKGSNAFAATITTIHGAIALLSRLTVCCPLYRGLASAQLPKPLHEANEYGCKAAVVPSFLSATSSVEPALDYADGTDAALLEISQSMGCRAADLSWLSQYPSENEYVFEPGTLLELHKMRVDGGVVIHQMRASHQPAQRQLPSSTLSHSVSAPSAAGWPTGTVPLPTAKVTKVILPLSSAAVAAAASANRAEEDEERPMAPPSISDAPSSQPDVPVNVHLNAEQRDLILRAVRQVDAASSELEASIAAKVMASRGPPPSTQPRGFVWP